jgi:hypothetical protein
MDELKQQKKQTRTLRTLALKQLSEDQVPDVSSTEYAAELDAYKTEKGQVSSLIQELQDEEDEIDVQMEEQSAYFDPAEMQMSMVGHADNETEKLKYDIARDRDRRTRKARSRTTNLTRTRDAQSHSTRRI